MARFVLVLLRHGHAEEGRGGGDHARRLSERGKKEARAVGAKLADPAWRPEAALVSDAARTRGTLAEVQAALGGDLPAEVRPELYLGVVDAVRQALSAPPPLCASAVSSRSTAEAQRGGSVEGEPSRLLVIGHNPTLSELATRLTRDYIALGTAEAVVLAVDAAAWAEAVQLDGAWELLATL